MELAWGLEHTRRWEVAGLGANVLGVPVCLTHKACLTHVGRGSLGVGLEVVASTRLTPEFRGRTRWSMGLPRGMSQPPGDWWNRAAVRDGAGGTVHYYRDRNDRIIAIQHKGKFYSP